SGAPQAASGGSSPPTKKPAKETAVVWKLRSSDNTMEPVQGSLGLTDHTFTKVARVLKGTLKESDEIVIRSILPKSRGPARIRREPWETPARRRLQPRRRTRSSESKTSTSITTSVRRACTPSGA